jgi:putative ABC transport system substrate-binding protein
MRRRRFLSGAAGALTIALTSHAQSLKRVLLLSITPEGHATSRVSALLDKLSRLGWVNGHTALFDLRQGLLSPLEIQKNLDDAVRLSPDVIVAVGSPVVSALRQSSRGIPVVFLGVSDPVAQGFVPEMHHPGGNMTGFATLEFSMAGKLVPELKSIVPELGRAVMLTNLVADRNTERFLPFIEAGAAAEGVTLTIANVLDLREMEKTIERMASQSGTGLVIPANSFMVGHFEELAAIALKHRVPSIAQYRVYAELGGLGAYGPGLAEYAKQHENAATYVDQILRGASPGDLPVQAPIRLELTLNLQTAKALGLTIPPTLLARADEVIE